MSEHVEQEATVEETELKVEDLEVSEEQAEDVKGGWGRNGGRPEQ